jgi:hypothetical protein
MNRIRYAWLVVQALCELVRFDLAYALRGFPGVHRPLVGHSLDNARDDRALTAAVCDAVLMATCLYWKPVLCLQRSVCATRLLRRHGIAARLVIGYRPVPFLSHAWVEVAGRVVNDSPAYQHRLRVLHTA